ncbi:MAG: hypothetical protein JXA78_09390 [Anaerolineales bacterium]|nr:hypothetical protein [Anaerolineales bacterium]
MSEHWNFKRSIFCFILLALGLSACWPIGAISPRRDDPGAILTSAASTISARLTLSAGETAVAQLTQMSQPTSGASAATPTPTSTMLPTFTPFPTATLVWSTPTAFPPTATRLPPTATRVRPTATPIPCAWAQFVKDVTIPDGALLAPGVQFTKVWRLRNIGSCAWGANYALVFVSGDRMRTSKVAPLPRLVRPGETVDLALDLVAPTSSGHYRGYWMLVNPYGVPFGIGSYAEKAFWVDIKVIASNPRFAFDFAANACAAVWRSSAHSLPCPGDRNSLDGSVNVLDQPVLENGKHEDEAALLTRPEARHDGWIMGVYPSYKLAAGDHFMADIGCLKNSEGCDVTFHLSYQLPSGKVQDVDSWREVYDGKIRSLDIDLSKLDGKSVRFILSVTNNGKASMANAFWLAPSIRKVKATPTPTPTRTATPTPTPTPTATSEWGHMPAVQAARQEIAQAVGVSPAQVIPLNVTPVEWSDTCLGIQAPGQVCAPAIIPGYRIILRISNQLFEAHTDELGNTVYWVPL